MPRFERNSFQTLVPPRSHEAKPALRSRGPIVLLDDCLTSYCEPKVNRAAVQVLEAAGYEVHLAGLPCCGRAVISKGLLAEAQQLARENIARLLPWAERGVPIVGCEPSCLLTLVDEYLDLVPGPEAQTVAAQAQLIDSASRGRHGIELPLRRPARRSCLLHGHCHQKALVGTAGTIAALQQVPGHERASCSTPAAAAWPARSATSTTT